MNSYEPHGTKITVRVRSSNDKQSWSAWEDAINGASLRLTPRGRYLEVEVTLEKFNSAQSPVVYDVTVNTLDSTALTTDLGASITGNQSSLNVGETVKLTVTAFNNGPNSASVKVNYKIPLGLKLLSSQGTGTYDSDTGIWNVGVLPAGGDATMELILQANNAGSIVNTAIVYSDLPDLNPLNNQAGFNLVANAPDLDDIPGDGLNGLPYDFPDEVKPPNNPPNNPPNQPPNNPPAPPTPPNPNPPIPPTPPGPGPGSSNPPRTQLDRDIGYVRGYVGYTPSNNQNTNDSSNGNQTTQPPQMPGWDVDTSVIEQLILASCLVSGGLAFAFLSDTDMKNKIAKFVVDKAAGKNFVFRPQDVALFALDVVCFLVSPDLFSYVMIVYQTFAFMQYIDILTKSVQTNIYAIFSAVILMLSLAVILKNIADNKLNSPLFNAIDWIEQFVKDYIKKLFGK
ncbi:MAG: DUF11 domain-containing protein [Methanobacterium sp.]